MSRQDSLPKGFTFWKQNFNDKTAGKLNFTNERLKETDLP